MSSSRPVKLVSIAAVTLQADPSKVLLVYCFDCRELAHNLVRYSRMSDLRSSLNTSIPISGEEQSTCYDKLSQRNILFLLLSKETKGTSDESEDGTNGIAHGII